MLEATRNPFEALLRYQAAPVGDDGGITKADRARALLRTKGALTAAEICEHVRFPNSGLVYAALKHDIAAGRVVFDGVRGGRYRWAADGVAVVCGHCGDEGHNAHNCGRVTAGMREDPCPGCERGGTCSSAGCGRKRSSELMRLYGIAGMPPSGGAQTK